jgi:hypothetical protein
MSPSRMLVHGHRRMLIVASFSLSVLIPSAAAAQSKEDANKLYKEGIALRAAGKHDQAVERFRRSLASEHQPQTYLALASELYELDKSAEALAALDALYAEFGATMKPQTRAKAEKARQIVEQEMGFGRIAITIQEKGTLFVDEKEAGTLPLDSSFRVKEGSHSLKIVRERGEPFVRDVVVAKGETMTVEVPPLPALVVEPPPKPIDPPPNVVEGPSGPDPKKIEPKPIAKPVIPIPSKRWHIGGHVAFMAGLGYAGPQVTTPPSTCGVYCLPSMSVLAGIDGAMSMPNGLLLGAGVEYLHASSTLNVASRVDNFSFPQGAANADMDLNHVFALDGGLAYVAIGTNVSVGKRIRLQGSIGPGVFIGRSRETVTGQLEPIPTAMQSTMTPVAVAETTETSETIVLPVLRPRLGVSFGLGRVWLGLAVEGVLSLTKGPAMCTPQLMANDVILEADRVRVDETGCPDGTRSARPFERILIASPAITVGTSF